MLCFYTSEWIVDCFVEHRNPADSTKVVKLAEV